MDTSLTTQTDAEKLNLSATEYNLIQQILNRSPNELELEIFALLWSEHASYKNSLKWLGLLPKEGDRVLVAAGKENAGAIDIGNGLACVFKVESHNHPCAVQPRLGASTGLRVVTRDVMSMGAKPLAILSSLRFGDDSRDTARWLFEEVVKGTTDFEKGFGIPVVGGEIFFNKGFNSSPIVNNMVIGVVDKNDLLKGNATGEGNLIAILGAQTGKDGIDDDAFAADLIDLLETKSVSIEELRDVSIEKQLSEAIQQLNKSKCIDGLQTVGAQGLVGAAAEMAAKGNNGINLFVDRVPTREKMTGREILFSETWGRMLICFKPRHTESIKQIASECKISMAIIGEIIEDTNLVCYHHEHKIAQIPAQYVGLGGNAPIYEPSYNEPTEKPNPILVDDLPEPDHYPNVMKLMIKGLNVASKKWLSEKFSKCIHNESENHKFPSDASFIPVNQNEISLVATMDCNPNYMKGDPYVGAQIAVAEAARNIICAGGVPLAVSDCLNFGNPSDSEAYWQFVGAIRGISKACNTFKTPVISGNVSFYNQRSEEGKIVPVIASPVIGMIGLLQEKGHHTTLSFKQKGDMIFLIGHSYNDVNGSEYLRLVHKTEPYAPPVYNEEEEVTVQQIVAGLIKHGLVRSVHDVSNGGLFFTLLESAIPLEFGFDITTDAEIRKDAFLFGESQSRVVVSVAPGKQDQFVDFMMESNVPFSLLGHVTKGEMRVDDESYGFVSDIKPKFEHTLKAWAEEQ
ncbi:MAG: phosphoribosylformylglycinamidine synthase subunit PurL [Breznakibacter sp.]